MTTLKSTAQSAQFTLLFVILALVAGGAIGLATTRLLSPVLALAAAVGFLVIMATLVSPELGMLILVFITYIRLSDVLTHFHSAPSIARPYAALLMVSVVLFWLRSGRAPQGWARAAILVGAYMLVVFASLFYASDILSAEEAAIDFFKDGILTILVVLVLQKKEMLRRVIWTLLLAGIFMGSLSVLQYITGAYDNNFFGFAQAPIKYISGGSSGARISGPIGDPNYYAQVMLVLIPLALNRLLSERSALLRILAGYALVLSSISVILTFSRGGFIAAAAMLLVWLIYHRPRPVQLLVIALLVMVVIALIPPSYIERISTVFGIASGEDSLQEDISVRGRTSEMISAWRMFLDHPFVGVGVGNYPSNYLEYSRQVGLDPRASERPAHNLYLEIAAETGLAGLIVFGILLYHIFRDVYMTWLGFIKMGNKEFAEMVAALGIGIFGYLSASMFIHAAYPRYFWLLAGVALSLPQVLKHAAGIYSSSVEGRQTPQISV